MNRRINWVNCLFNGDNTLDDEDSEDSEYNDSYDNNSRIGASLSGKFIQTPMGISQISERMSPFEDTEFFAAYTNFSITVPLALDIEMVEGVEYLKVYGRYRFIVGFGNMFDITEVVSNIEKILSVDNKSYEVSPIKKKIEEYLISTNSEKVVDWVAYVFPNGKYEVLPCKNSEDMIKNKELARELQSYSNGVIVTSED